MNIRRRPRLFLFALLVVSVAGCQVEENHRIPQVDKDGRFARVAQVSPLMVDHMEGHSNFEPIFIGVQAEDQVTPLLVDQLEIGDHIKLWTTGILMESYPPQMIAVKIERVEEGELLSMKATVLEKADSLLIVDDRGVSVHVSLNKEQSLLMDEIEVDDQIDLTYTVIEAGDYMNREYHPPLIAAEGIEIVRKE
ncbi:DUF3221 domain-containing protein [Shouchella lonarensis]|uniref:Uncharacterized protein n=1 Tax=Shouchella lonarensis TaxID=1464122 RepID=A0A1G6HBW3_9BACI|nr:DUF3221 domain-containing protein [Shouchella lonarensis]SDB90926.1 Protein of unknown function [Shouchella lonarensis]